MNSKIKNATFSFLFYLLASLLFVIKKFSEGQGSTTNLYYYGIFICLALAIFFMIRLVINIFK